MTVYRENGADGTVKVGISYAAHNDHDRDCENDHVNDCDNDHVNDQVKWRTVAGTAVEGEDYEGAEGELVYTRFTASSSSLALYSSYNPRHHCIVIMTRI